MFDESDYIDTATHHGILTDHGNTKPTTDCNSIAMAASATSTYHHHHHSNFILEPSNINVHAVDGTNHELNFDLETDDQFNNVHLIQDVLQNNHPSLDQNFSSAAVNGNVPWESNDMQELALHLQQQQQQQLQINSLSNMNYNVLSSPGGSYNTTQPSDFLNLLHLPRCSMLPPPTSAPFMKPTGFHHNPLENIFGEMNGNDSNSALSVMYDPLHLSFPPNPPLLRDLFQSLPQSSFVHHLPSIGGLKGTSNGYFGMDHHLHDKDQILGGGGIFGDQLGGDNIGFGNSSSAVLDFRREICGLKGGSGGDVGKGTNHFATEKQRRESLNEKYKSLRALVPNPTKSDRASVVGDAIDYIKELLRTVDELKILVDKKRCAGGGGDHGNYKRQKLAAAGDDQESGSTAADHQHLLLETSPNSNNGSAAVTDHQAAVAGGLMGVNGTSCTDHQNYNNNVKEQTFSGSTLRSSWLQRTSKGGTWVDVRIVDDEVTIKLTQRKKKNCLLFVSKILDELQLEILHVNGANFGDHNIFLFNTKIFEGSCVYASAIANKLIEVVDRHYLVFPSSL